MTQTPTRYCDLVMKGGITSGIVSPWVIGLIKTQTGSMDNALYLLTALLFMSGIALLRGVPKQRPVE